MYLCAEEMNPVATPKWLAEVAVTTRPGDVVLEVRIRALLIPRKLEVWARTDAAGRPSGCGRVGLVGCVVRGHLSGCVRSGGWSVVGTSVGALVGSSVGLKVGLAVGAEVAAHAVVLPEIVTKPSRHGHEYV